MSQKISTRWHTISLWLSGINTVIIFFFVWHLFIYPSDGHGTGMALGILLLFTAAPLSIIGLLLTLIFARTKKTILLALLPILIFGLSVWWDEMSIRSFDPAEYQYLIGEDFSSIGTGITDHINGQGQNTDIPKKTSYDLDGMQIIVNTQTNKVEQVIPK